VYWAQLITVALVTPLSFVLNKLWTFRAVRGRSGLPLAEEATERELDLDVAQFPEDAPIVEQLHHRPQSDGS
jgi:hypothetical protein